MSTSRIVALSGGKDSTAMALHLIDVEPMDYEFCITPTGRELPAMMDHWAKLECLLGKPLVRVPAPSLVELIVKYKTVPNFRMRFCTRQIKIEPFQAYAEEKAPAICYVGIRADEVDGRAGSDHSKLEGVSQDFPLARWGWNIGDVRNYLRKRGVQVPERTDCDWCYHQQIGEWWRLWKDHPQRWQEGEAIELWTGHTFRSDKRDSWPAAMQDLRLKFEAGFVPKGAAQMNMPMDITERPTMCAWCAR